MKRISKQSLEMVGKVALRCNPFGLLTAFDSLQRQKRGSDTKVCHCMTQFGHDQYIICSFTALQLLLHWGVQQENLSPLLRMQIFIQFVNSHYSNFLEYLQPRYLILGQPQPFLLLLNTPCTPPFIANVRRRHPHYSNERW